MRIPPLPSISLKRFNTFFSVIPARLRILLATGIMMIGITASTFFPLGSAWLWFIIILTICAYVTTYIAIYEGIDGVEWYLLFIMPIFFTLALYLFYFLLPVRWLTRLPFLMIFAAGYYSILLTSNIFNVGVEKSIQLYRAAFSINVLMQTIIIFLWSVVVFSFRFNFVISALIISSIAVLVSAQLLWTVTLRQSLEIKLVRYAGIQGIVLFELCMVLAFMPFKLNIAALIFTAAYYSSINILYHYSGERLFKNVVRENSLVFIFVFIIALFTI
ncbi:MAG: hypothetical protein O3B87_02635 [bacterium]|nr:hypothetical protein [bacterium]